MGSSSGVRARSRRIAAVVLWFAVCLGMPQVSTEYFRGIYPFFNWRLFSVTYDRHFDLYVTGCGGTPFKTPLRLLDQNGALRLRDRSKLGFRLYAITQVFDAGDPAFGKRLLRELIQTNVVKNEKCQFVIYSFHLDVDRIDNLPPGTDYRRIEDSLVEI